MKLPASSYQLPAAVHGLPAYSRQLSAFSKNGASQLEAAGSWKLEAGR